ncbi:MAG: fibronectin type III domain-containing protein [Desulfuromusa sp.]|jgi:hypothetical protein|nr:fibronectin type III domain-containing protein [Desulfuromusa sp.]
MKSYQILVITFLLIVNFISVAFCQDITLSWDPSPTQDVVGYKVYYKQGNMDFPFDGTGANEGVSPVDVGDRLSTTLTGLSDGVIYFFTVTAYQSPDTESTYSNIVSNSWLPSLTIPANNAVNEPIPVTFQWQTAPAGYDVTYTLYYGTDKNEVSSAGSFISPPPTSGDNLKPVGIILVLLLCLTVLTILTKFKLITPIKPLRSACSLLLIILLGGLLTACSGGGGGGDSSSSRSASSTETVATESVLYAINKGSSDYHQAFDLSASTTYFWKVVAKDTQDPNLTYESEVRTFTTETF